MAALRLKVPSGSQDGPGWKGSQWLIFSRAIPAHRIVSGHLWDIPREDSPPSLGSAPDWALPRAALLPPVLIQVFHLPLHGVKASSLIPGSHERFHRECE